MNFISYAQNLEDVMLWRALKNYQSGFYIDVGACDPTVDSVTKAFYDKGWRGINIEPVPAAFEKLSAARPRDINLKMAAGASSGTRKFYSVDGGNGLSTTVKEYAERYDNESRAIEEIEVETKTLAQICAAFVDQDVSFLKIDVEGGEKAVLEGADFSRFRPWIIVIESTEPNTTKPSHDDWESILLDAAYTYVYFDGLNRYYIANEKIQFLGGAFATPPNWFDHYETSSQVNLRDVNEKMAQQLMNLERIVFPSFIEEEGTVFDKIQKLIDNHLFLSEKVMMQTDANIQATQETAEMARTLAMLRNEAENAQHQLKDLKDALNSSTVAIHDAEQKNTLARAEVEQLRDANARLIAENRELLQQNSKLNTEADAYHQELYESSRHIGAMSKERSNMNATIASLEHHVRHYTAQHAGAQQRVTELMSENAKFHNDIATLHNDIATLHTHIAAVTGQVKALISSRSWKITAPLRRLSSGPKDSGKNHA